MTSDDPFLFCPKGHQRPYREGQTTQWTKEKGFIRGHTEKDRQPNGQKREGSSEVIKRRRTDNPMEKREWDLSLLSIGLSVLLLVMASDNLFCPSLYDI
jgi:hypothetical protein